MSLKIALLLIGVGIIIIVAIGAMDKARIRRRRARRAPPDEFSTPPIAVVDDDIPDTVRMDAGNRQPGALGKPKLKTDSPASLFELAKPNRRFLNELESYEQAADLRLDVDPEIDSRLDNSGESREPTRTDLPTVAHKVIDFVITLPARKAIPRNRALGLFRQNEYMLDKPRAIYGLRHVTGVWSNIETDPEGIDYDDLKLALQIVDDAGAVSESELNTFVQMGLTFGDQLRRRTLFSLDVDEVIELARDLENFCKKHDVIASINIVANSPVGFPGNTIAAVANDLGMRFGEMNIFHRYDSNARLEFSMANLFQPGDFNRDNLEAFRTKGLTLFMQVPRTLESAAVFGDMIGAAIQMADRMGGRLVDQDMKPLTKSGINTIRTQIESIADDMRKRGISPGSEAALRLFHA